MLKSTGLYPKLHVDASGDRVVSHAGSVVLTATADVVGLGAALSATLAPWRKPHAVHNPAKILLDLAVSVAVGGDCLSDIATLRGEVNVFGSVASDPTVSRLIDLLAGDVDAGLTAINTARAQARMRAWKLAGADAPDHDIDGDRPLVVDLDATLVTAHSEKEKAAPNFKHGFGFHPLGAWIDHGQGGTGEPAAMLLRPGNAGSNTAADHIGVTKLALRQLPGHRTGSRPGRKVLIRTDGGGCSREFLTWLHNQRLSYSVGWRLTPDIVDQIRKIPQSAWTAAINTDRTPRDGAWVADATGMVTLTGWPKGLRVIVRAERPHPGAQLTFTDPDGNRPTAFATNTVHGQHADLELRHRQRARCEDRIRAAKDTGLRNLPLHDFAQNKIWAAVVMLASELIAWARPDRHLGPHLGTETPTPPGVLDRRPHRSPQPQDLAATRHPRTPRPPRDRRPESLTAPAATDLTPHQDPAHPRFRMQLSGRGTRRHRSTPGQQSYPRAERRPENWSRYQTRDHPTAARKIEASADRDWFCLS